MLSSLFDEFSYYGVGTEPTRRGSLTLLIDEATVDEATVKRVLLRGKRGPVAKKRGNF